MASTRTSFDGHDAPVCVAWGGEREIDGVVCVYMCVEKKAAEKETRLTWRDETMVDGRGGDGQADCKALGLEWSDADDGGSA
jgi:hypothetical protein